MKAPIAGTAAAALLAATGLGWPSGASAHDHGYVSHIRVTVEEDHRAPHDVHGWSHGAWSHEVWTYRAHALPHHAGWRHGWKRWGHHRPHHGGARLGWGTGARHHGGHGGWAVTLYGGH